MKEYKILLVDDHEIIINGIMNALLPWPHFKIVEHVKNGLEVYNACCAYEPDILILALILVYLASMAWISFLNYISVGQQ